MEMSLRSSGGVSCDFISSRDSFASSLIRSRGLVEEEAGPSYGLDMTSEVSLLTGVGYWIAPKERGPGRDEWDE